MQNEDIKVSEDSERVNFKNLQIVNTLENVVMRQWVNVYFPQAAGSLSGYF